MVGFGHPHELPHWCDRFTTGHYSERKNFDSTLIKQSTKAVFKASIISWPWPWQNNRKFYTSISSQAQPFHSGSEFYVKIGNNHHSYKKCHCDFVREAAVLSHVLSFCIVTISNTKMEFPNQLYAKWNSSSMLDMFRQKNFYLRLRLRLQIGYELTWKTALEKYLLRESLRDATTPATDPDLLDLSW